MPLQKARRAGCYPRDANFTNKDTICVARRTMARRAILIVNLGNGTVRRLSSMRGGERCSTSSRRSCSTSASPRRDRLRSGARTRPSRSASRSSSVAPAPRAGRSKRMGPPERPLLKPWYRLAAEGGRSVLRYAGSVLEFDGAAAERLLPHLLPLLDGTRTVDEVVAELGDPVRPAVEHALSLLRGHELLTDGVAGSSPACELLAATTGRTVAEIRRRVAGAEIHVLGSGATAESICRLLERSNRLDWTESPPR